MPITRTTGEDKRFRHHFSSMSAAILSGITTRFICKKAILSLSEVLTMANVAAREKNLALGTSGEGSDAAARSITPRRIHKRGMRYALSYAAQQVSGLWSWVEDPDHIEKAFDIGGMGARNGVTAVTMVQAT